MSRLVFAIGLTAAGEPVAIYLGKDADAARLALDQAGASKQIETGYLFRNPSPDRRITYTRTDNERAAEQAATERHARTAAEKAEAATKAQAVATEAVDLITRRIAEQSDDPAPAISYAAAAAPAADPSDPPDPSDHFGARRRKKP